MSGKIKISIIAGLLLTGILVWVIASKYSGETSKAPLAEKKKTDNDSKKIKAKLALFKETPGKEIAASIKSLANKKGKEREQSWKLASLGLNEKENIETRLRSARLVTKLSAKADGISKGPINKEIIAPLLRSLESDNPKLISHSLQALGTMHLVNAKLNLKEKCLPPIKKLLASEKAELSKAALVCLPMFKTTELIPELLKAWKKHEKVKDFEKHSLATLKILSTEHYKNQEQKKNPKTHKSSWWKIAKAKAGLLSKRLGNDRKMWKNWWKKEQK